MMAVALEQREIMEANAQAVLLSEEGKIVDQSILASVHNYGEDLKSLVADKLSLASEKSQDLYKLPPRDIASRVIPVANYSNNIPEYRERSENVNIDNNYRSDGRVENTFLKQKVNVNFKSPQSIAISQAYPNNQNSFDVSIPESQSPRKISVSDNLASNAVRDIDEFPSLHSVSKSGAQLSDSFQHSQTPSNSAESMPLPLVTTAQINSTPNKSRVNSFEQLISRKQPAAASDTVISTHSSDAVLLNSPRLQAVPAATTEQSTASTIIITGGEVAEATATTVPQSLHADDESSDEFETTAEVPPVTVKPEISLPAALQALKALFQVVENAVLFTSAKDIYAASSHIFSTEELSAAVQLIDEAAKQGKVEQSAGEAKGVAAGVPNLIIGLAVKLIVQSKADLLIPMYARFLMVNIFRVHYILLMFQSAFHMKMIIII